jgi:inner membrane protein
MKQPLLSRALAIAAVAVAILVPISMIGNKVSERQHRANAVVAQFAAETSGPQLVIGPFLALTCEETFHDERRATRDGRTETFPEKKTVSCPTAYFTPRTFKATASMPVETRHRGIYPIRLYRAEVELAGEFDWPEPPAPNGATQRAWKNAYVGYFVKDPRGIKALSSNLPSDFLAGLGEPGLEQFSIRESLGPYASRNAGAPTPASLKLTLIGTSGLQVAPVGDRSEIRLASNWPHPSFTDAWSPDERRIAADGFEAMWRITSLATGGQAKWKKLASDGKLASSVGAGVSLFDPVNIYALSYRATEYAFLFVLITFSALALTEAVAGVRLHAVQYALVGSAIAIFFLLLIALSEHLAFAAAYATAAAACVALLTIYLRHPLGTLPRTAAFFGIFVALYAALYTILKSEDHALLLGSSLVFLLLAIAMTATRKLDWASLWAKAAASPLAAAGKPSSP